MLSISISMQRIGLYVKCSLRPSNILCTYKCHLYAYSQKQTVNVSAAAGAAAGSADDNQGGALVPAVAANGAPMAQDADPSPPLMQLIPPHQLPTQVRGYGFVLK